MSLQVDRVDVWAAGVQDKPGRLAEKLRMLADGGANLEMVISRRAPEHSGTGVVFVTPIKGTGQMRAAKQAGFDKTESLHSVRIEGADKPGIGAQITGALGDASVNLRGFSAAAVGRKFVCYLALDSAADAAKAIRVLKRT